CHGFRHELRSRLAAVSVLAAATAAVVSATPGGTHAAPALTGIHKIRHVIVIMQENRSFDSYFGTYPGADGIPGLAGNPGRVPCSPDPKTHGCVEPYHNTSDRNAGGPHAAKDAIRDIDGGKMDGFQREARRGRFLA